MLGHAIRNISYKGMTEEEYQKLCYYLKFCIEIANGDVRNVQAIYKDGILNVKGITVNWVECRFEGTGYFDEDTMTFFIISKVYLPDGELRQATDTFQFLGDKIIVTSNTDQLEFKSSTEIPYYVNQMHR